MLNYKSDSSASRKSFSVILTLALVISFIPTLAFPKVSSAVENKDGQTTSLKGCESGVVYPGRQRTQEEIEELLRQGYIADNFDASDIDYKNTINAYGGANLSSNTQTLPIKVDLRNTGKVTPVKSQGYTGTCWAWATVAAAETSIANSTGQSATNYSAYHAAYFGLTPLSSNVSELKGTEKTQAGEGVSASSQDKSNLFSVSGTAFQVASLMMQGVGPATEQSIPFPLQSLQDGKFYEKNALTAEQRRESIARLSKWNNFGSLITTKTESEQTTYVGTDESVLLNMKKTLAGGNAVIIGFYADVNEDPTADVYFNNSTKAQYTYKYEPMNHYVCVVGYDDNFSKDRFVDGHKPEKDGAFIVKNSWDNDWGDAGYFYLSYYDQSIVTASSLEFDTPEFDEGQIDGEEIVDQYDYLQLGDYINTVYDLANSPNNRAWYSNIYTATQKQQLHHIGTYVLAGANTLGYKVYKLRSDAVSPMIVEGSIDSPFAAGEVNVENEGYTSVKLDKALNLQQGEKYSIWFYQASRSNVYFVPQMVSPKNMGNYAASAVVNRQESFSSCDPTVSWDAMTSAIHSGYGEYAGIDAVQDNFCVKGYSTSAEGYFFVGFNSNGGTSVDSQFLKNGEKIAEPTSPTKQGSTFAGWYKDEALTQEFNFNSDTVSADTTLFAKWNVVDETTNADEAVEEAATPTTLVSASSDDVKQANLPQTGDDSIPVANAVIAVATVAFVCMQLSSPRRSHPKHAKH